jgi:hypothetical protein
MKTRTLLAVMALLAATLPAAGAGIPRYGAGVRVSFFGVPNALLDLALDEHPKLAGSAFSFEIHSYGKKGPQSVFSGIYCLEYNRISGAGYFRVEKEDKRFSGSGEITQVNFTATILVHIFPSSPVHPYVGAGIGIGRMSVWAEGSYQERGITVRDTYEKKAFVPVVHIPVGIMGNINDKCLIRAEAGFKNGFYIGGSLVVNF